MKSHAREQKKKKTKFPRIDDEMVTGQKREEART
jgi:hypothetical protein